MAGKHVILIGPPGSGKGTQASRVADKLGLVHLSTGDVLRDAVGRGTELGRKAQDYMKQGLLVPDEIMLGLIREQFDQLGGKGWILDGFPRTLPQAESLTEILEETGLDIDSVILIDVSREEITKRLTSRRVCGGCGAVYNLATMPEGVDEICSKCGGQLTTRPDDNEETVKRRLDVYEEQTAPVLGFYRRTVGVTEIDGSGEIDDITAEMIRELR